MTSLTMLSTSRPATIHGRGGAPTRSAAARPHGAHRSRPAASGWLAHALLGALLGLAGPASASSDVAGAWADTTPAPGGQVELDSPIEPLDPPPTPIPTAPVEELLFTYAFPGMSDDEARQFIEERAATEPREIELNYALIDKVVRDPGAAVWIVTPDGERVQFLISRPCRIRMALTSCSGWSTDRHDLLTFGVTADRQSPYVTLLRNGNYRTERLPDGRLILFRIDWTRLSRPQ